MKYRKLNQALTETQKILSAEWDFNDVSEKKTDRFGFCVQTIATGVMQAGDYFCPSIEYSKQGKNEKVSSIYSLCFFVDFGNCKKFSFRFLDDFQNGWILDKVNFEGGSDTFSKFRHTLAIMRYHGVEFSKDVEAMCERVAVDEIRN